ncbi:MAG: tRNA pseudouridine(55) synthase TruB [Bacteroidales bacterium]
MTGGQSVNRFQEGEILLINKPLGWTSFDAVKKIRNVISRETGIKKIKVGHAGTLDPLADGLLIICTGRFTKKIEQFQEMEKEYTGTFFLGATTPSFDSETEIDQTWDTDHLPDEMLRKCAAGFLGESDQIPPLFSAIKTDGVRAYHHARNQDIVELKPRRIAISRFDLTRIELPEVDFLVTCSKGTYIRALARDFGIALRSGAHLTKLTRTRIGHYSLTDAMRLVEFEQQIRELHNPGQQDDE